MPWFGNYYYRSKRVNGRPRKIYVGGGEIGEKAAEEDRLERIRKQEANRRHKEQWNEQSVLDASLQEVIRITEELARRALQAAGFRQHCKGDWRRTRDHN